MPYCEDGNTLCQVLKMHYKIVSCLSVLLNQRFYGQWKEDVD